MRTSATEDHTLSEYYVIRGDGNMEAQNLTSVRRQTIPQRLLSAVVPVLFVAVSYVDPGKWAAAVEGGARFDLDLFLLLLMFSFAAILCQYLSARIAVVTGRDLAKVCSVEYDSITCIVLGAQAELSMIGLDLMMVVGTAHGLNVLFGIDLFTGVLLTAVNTLALPLFAILLDDGKVNLLAVCFSMVILLFYAFEVLLGQPKNPQSLGGISARLNGESIFALMSLLGSNIMPHNFYLHSSLIQQVSRPGDVPKGELCHDHLFAIFSIFSGIFFVHYELMSSAAIELSSLSTFQDILDQVFRSSIAPLALIALMFFSNQVMAVSWNHGGQVVVHNMLKLEIPGWLHHATIRIIAIIPALCCSWSSGAEGIYQLLIFTQVMIALMLPASVIPLFRVASSSSIMGIYKISRFEEFLALVTFVGMLGLNVLFFMELMFGNTEWANNLWDTGSSVPIAYVILVVSASVSFCLMLWLVATPLKSVSSRINAQVYDWSGDIIQSSEFESFVPREQNDFSVSEDQVEGIEKQEPGMEPVNSLGSFLDLSTSTANLNLPDTLYDSEDVGQLTTIDEKASEVNFPVSSNEGSATKGGDTYLDSNSRATGSNAESQDDLMLSKSVDSVEKTSGVDGDSQQSATHDGESTVFDNANQSLASDGPGSFRSLSGKNDEPGSGTGSLSKLAGLGRAGRRQLTIILDEFWGQMFDFHGQVTVEASAKKLDTVLGLACKVDAKSSSSSIKMDNNRAKELIGNFPSDSMITSSLCNSNQQTGQGMYGSSSYGGMQRRSTSSLWSTHLQPLDAYTGRNPLDYTERRYSSMRVPSSSDSYEQQPATVHGYELAYLSRISKQREAMNNGQIEPLAPPVYTYPTQMSNERDSSPTLNGGGQVEAFGPKSTSLTTMSRYGDSVGGRPSIRRPLNSVSSLTPPGFEKVAISRNSSLRLDRSVFNTPSSPKPIGSGMNNSADAKRYHSLPDISGLRIPHQDSSSPMFNQSRQWDNSLSTGPTFEQQQRISSGYAPSEVCKDAFSLQYSSGLSTGSMWSRQPYEHFGVADKSHVEVGGEQQVNNNSRSSCAQETAIDSEAKLLQSFRYCIMRILKLDGSEWLFKQNDGTDEDLIDRVAAREKFLYEAESTQILNQQNIAVSSQSHLYSDRNKAAAAAVSPLRTTEDVDYMKFLVTSVPHCGEGCVYKVDLVVSFGVWCIHRILELSLMESRPELWGKYTFVLNRLQGIMELAFFRARSPMTPCFCLQLPDGWQQKSSSSSPSTNGNMQQQLLPPHPKAAGHGKCTTAAMLVEIIKDVELAISCRKGRTGTAAGDVAFPKGKENLASVLKRYKRRLSSKSIGGNQESRKVVSSSSSSQR